MEKAPIIPDFLRDRDIMYSPKPSEDVFNETLLYCSQLLGHIHSADNFEIQASFYSESMLYVSFKIYTVSFEEVELTGICMDMINGDYLKYKHLFELFNERVQHSFLPVSLDDSQPLKKHKSCV